MDIHVVTLFPEQLERALEFGVTGRALATELARLTTWNPRDYADDERGTVDDRPFGGGPGMVFKAQVLASCLAAVKRQAPQATVRYLSPQGRQIRQAELAGWATEPSQIWLCGRYEGIDERLVEGDIDEEWSLGDFVLSGGEPAALTVIDGLLRLLPGTLGHDASAAEDSFSDGLLDCPHYTRPEAWRGLDVPAVLKSGDHGAIARWRQQQALGRTWERRPELLARRNMTAEERQLLVEYLEQRRLALNEK